MHGLDLTFAETARTPPLSAAEEREMLTGWDDGPARRKEIQEALVLRNRQFALSKALECRDWQHPLEDLISAALLGLCEAARRFDPCRGVRFISYAVWWIRQAIRYEFQQHHRTVRLPISVQEDYTHLAEEVRRSPGGADVDEIAEAMKWSRARVENALLVPVRTWPLDVDRDDWKPRYDIVPDDGPLPDACVREVGNREQVDLLMSTLTSREAAIVRAYFGMDSGGERPTLQDIADDYKLSRERIRQIVEKAMEKMRSKARRSRKWRALLSARA